MLDHNNFALAQALAHTLQAQSLTLAVAESCTGGGLAYQLTAIPGSSQWFECGFVVYQDRAKRALLDIDAEVLKQYGAVSEQVAMALAQGALARSHADIALSITGIAGPEGGSSIVPVGTVWFGLAQQHQPIQARHILLAGGRQHVRHHAIGFALHWLLTELKA